MPLSATTQDSSHEILGLQPDLDLRSRLGLISLIDDQLRSKAASAPIFEDMFSEVNDLVDVTVKGSKINRLNPEAKKNGFHIIEINADSGANLGRINMLYLNKPIPCFYLVYVEVLPFFRKKGLGNRILHHFRGFLDEKGAVGILDNVIPRSDPTYAIYYKQAWEPIEHIIGESLTTDDENYMVYIPPQLRHKNLVEPFRKLLVHLKRKRTAIEMRDNENMVKGTLAEFKEIYAALTTYFQSEIDSKDPSPAMRFMFTRFVTKFIRFRRKIGELIGYTGGESTEQIELSQGVADLPIMSIAPKDLTGDSLSITGEREVCQRIMETMAFQPALAIESLPNLMQPRLQKWLAANNKEADHCFTISDLMELGYDPTRLKEITIDGTTYVLDRISRRVLPDYKEKQRLLEQLSPLIGNQQARGARLMINKPLAVIQDMGNAYVVRRKIDAIRWDEAQEQIQQNDHLQRMSQSMRLEQLLVATVRAAGKVLNDLAGIEANTAFEKFSWMVSWDVKTNHPGLYADFSGPVFETIWIT